MRRALLLLCCSSLAVAAELDQLAQLNRNHRFFDLRRALDQPGANAAETLFYRGVVACRFGHENQGIALLRKFLAANPSGPMARQVYEELAGAYERLTRYKDAARAWAEWLELTPRDDPERADNADTQAFMDSIGDVPPESVLFGVNTPVRATRNPVGDWNVPVRINGLTGDWIFDTGANISTITESEAKRLGLAVRDSKATVYGSTGQKNPLRIAVAGTLEFGGAQFHNVLFLVIADEAMKVSALHYQISGILGMPVMRALGRVGVAESGEVIMSSAEPASAGPPNLWFDEGSAIVEIVHDRHPLQMFLDSGANATTLYPPFRSALSIDEQSHLRNKHDKTSGVGGGIVRRNVKVIPRLEFELSGKPIDLKKVTLLSQAPRGSSPYRDGVIGMDALWNGFLLDFSAMRLESLP